MHFIEFKLYSTEKNWTFQVSCVSISFCTSSVFLHVKCSFYSQIMSHHAPSLSQGFTACIKIIYLVFLSYYCATSTSHLAIFFTKVHLTESGNLPPSVCLFHLRIISYNCYNHLFYFVLNITSVRGKKKKTKEHFLKINSAAVKLCTTNELRGCKPCVLLLLKVSALDGPLQLLAVTLCVSHHLSSVKLLYFHVNMNIPMHTLWFVSTTMELETICSVCWKNSTKCKIL